MEASGVQMAISNRATVGANQRKRKSGAADGVSPSQSSLFKWRTETEQKTYSSKLLEALRRVRGVNPGGASSGSLPRIRAVREAADRALAVAARGRTHWSRAILSSRALVLKARRRRPRAPPQSKELVDPTVGQSKKKRSDLALRQKAMVLGCLVPGCRKLSFPRLLAEASDYIAALEMQVGAMAALSEIISVASATASQPRS